MRLSLFLPLFFLVSLAAAAEWSKDLGPSVGEAIPHPVTGPDQSGTERTLADLSGEKGAVLVFFRSADWCPFCKAQLNSINARQAEVDATGYKLVGISYDSVDKLKSFADANEIRFPLISDEGSEIIKGFGILNTEYPERSGAYGVPYPMMIVVDTDGVVQAKLAEEGYRNRPEIDVLLAAISSIG